MADVLVVIILVAMFSTGWARGIPRQLWALVVLAASTYVAGTLYPNISTLTGRFIQDPQASRLLAFALVYGVTSGVLGGPVAAAVGMSGKRSRKSSWMGDRLASGVLGAIEGIGALEVMALVLVAFPVLGWDGWMTSSDLIAGFLTRFPLMAPLLPEEISAVVSLFK